MELNVKQSGIERRTFTTTFQKTRSNKVNKRVHELYLRNDIPCGLSLCKSCKYEDLTPLQFVDNANYSKTVPFRHFLVLDGLTILKFVDVLNESVFRQIIIPQSAWNYVKKLNPSIYKRMNSLYVENRDRFFVFLNEFVSETFVDPGLNRLPEFYQEKCLLKTAKYLESHWKEYDIHPIVICSNDDAKEKFFKEFFNVFTLHDYTKEIDGCVKIAERLEDLSRDKGRGKVLFPEHWTQDQLLDGLAKGAVKKGKFQLSMENYLEASISFDFGVQWFIQGETNMNRAIHGDIVVAELLPQSQWTCPEKAIRLRDAEEVTAKNGIVDNEGEDESGAFDSSNSDGVEKKRPKLDALDVVPTARIVGILRRNWRNYCGIILPPNIEGGRRYLFSPTERLVPRIRIETSHYAELRGKKILVQIDSWPQDSHYPKGHYIRIIGTEGERKTEDEVILLEHEIPYGDFSSAVLACLPQMPWKPEPSTYRVDLTHLDVCSVDPEGCTDIDDALHCVELGESRFEVGVHIADVTHFVRPGNAMDTEAAERSTTVYLCGRRIDMLPELLSSNLCSLRENELRYAFSVIWILKEGEDETKNQTVSIESVKFMKSLINSRASLTYQKAQEIINDNEKYTDNISKSLRHLLRLSRYLKAKRKIMGALELSSSEVRFDVDRETGMPLKVMTKDPLPTMSMIEEFMLLANISVAEKILESFPDCAILRRHPVPSRDSFKPVIEIAKSCGYQMNVDTGKELAKSLEQIDAKHKDESDKEKNLVGQMLRMLTTRCMTQAVYFAAGTLPVDQYLHYGLAAKVYTHFTSPIRRYADVMVHRLLATLIDVDKVYPAMVERKTLVRQTENMNKRHRQAQYASRASILLNTFLMIKEHAEPSLDAIVISIRKNGIQIHVPKYGLESVIFINEDNKSMKNDNDVMFEFFGGKIRLFKVFALAYLWKNAINVVGSMLNLLSLILKDLA